MAKSGNAAGSGLAEMVPSPPRKLQERPGSQITSSSALTDSKSAGTKREPEFNIRVRETVDVVSRKLTCVEAMLDPAVPMYCNPENTEPAVVEMLTDNSDNAVVSTLKMPVTLPPSPRTGTETSHVIVAALTGPTCVSVSDAPTAAIARKFLRVILAPENARHGVNTCIFRLVRQWPLDQAFSHAAVMSALGQKRTCAVQLGMSALPPKADIRGRGWTPLDRLALRRMVQGFQGMAILLDNVLRRPALFFAPTE